MDCSLKDFFHEIFYIKGIWMLVSEHMCIHNDEVHWNITFIRLVHDWELESVTSFFNTLYSCRMVRGGQR